MKRAALLSGPLGIFLSVAVVLGMARCEGRRSDNLTTVIGAQAGVNTVEVMQMMSDAASYALARSPNASVVITIVDREARILGELTTVVPAPQGGTMDRLTTTNVPGGVFPDPQQQAQLVASESRAGSGAFFSSNGEAFTGETAFFIIGENYPPQTRNEDVGPLFGVQNSSFFASDIIAIANRFDIRDALARQTAGIAPAIRNLQNNSADVSLMPNLIDASITNAGNQNNLPNLGLNAAGGGVVGIVQAPVPGQPSAEAALPLHRLGAHVGGVGVAGADFISNTDIALYAQFNFQPPLGIRADRVFIDGVRVPYTRTNFQILQFPTLSLQQLVANANAGLPGARIIQGPRSTLNQIFDPNNPRDFNQQRAPLAYIQARNQTLQNAQQANPQAPNPIAAAQSFGIFPAIDSVAFVDIQTVKQPNPVLISGIIKNAFRASPNMGTDGTPATRDFVQVPNDIALQFGDVATVIRSGAEMALNVRAGIRRPLGLNAVVHICAVDQNGLNLGCFAMDDATVFSYDVAFQKARVCAFFSDSTAAFAARSIGVVSQPHLPIGIDDTPPGPLYDIQTLYNPLGDLLHARLNGFEVFPGGAPLYKGNVCIGAVGVSGDGVDQDDQITFGGQLPPFSTPLSVRCDVIPQEIIVPALRRGVVRLINATNDAITNVVANGPPANRPNALSQLQALQALLNQKALELSNNGRLSDTPLPFLKVARGPNLFDTQ